MKFDRAQLDIMPKRKRTNFINSLSGVKSANLVGTTSISGINNLALISSVFHVGANPPLLGMLFRPHTVRRDTLENITASGCFTINHVNEQIITQAHQCSAKYDAMADEFAEVGLNPQISSLCNAPYVQESKVKIALKLQESHLIKANDTQIIIGEIVEVICPQELIEDNGNVDLASANCVGLEGLDTYLKLSSIIRLQYARPDKA